MPLTVFKLLNYGETSSATKLHTTNPTWPFQKNRHQRWFVFVAVENEVIVGTIMAGYDGHRGWLYSVAVDPGKRLHGLGTALVHHAENALAELGCMKVNLQLLDTNEATAAFYKSIGYAVEPRLSMGKLL